MQPKKQPTKKRAYRKRKNIAPAEKANNNLIPIKLTNKDTEVESLAAIISIFDNWDSEQRSRNLKYLASRYYDFL